MHLYVKVKNGEAGREYFAPKEEYERIKAHEGNFLLKKFVAELRRVDEIDYTVSVSGGVATFTPYAPE